MRHRENASFRYKQKCISSFYDDEHQYVKALISAIDPDVAASRLRGDTEKIAACIDHPHPASDPASVIKWVRGGELLRKRRIARCAYRSISNGRMGCRGRNAGSNRGIILDPRCDRRRISLSSRAPTLVKFADLGPTVAPYWLYLTIRSYASCSHPHMNCDLAATSDAVLFRSLRSAMHSRNAEPF